ncbi:MAG: hypothetical protein AAGG08_09925 [Actinomycetota bacterium]
MTERIGIKELRSMTAERVRQISLTGESVVITVRGAAVARIVPERPPRSVRSLLDRVVAREPVDTGALTELIDDRARSAEPVDADWTRA